MNWLAGNLRAPVDLRGCQKPKPQPRSKEDTGQKQAVPAEPGMLVFLVNLIARFAAEDDWRTPALCCAFTLAVANMRLGHLGRSRFLRRTASSFWMRAYRGKSRDSQGLRPVYGPLGVHCRPGHRAAPGGQ